LERRRLGLKAPKKFSLEKMRLQRRPIKEEVKKDCE